MSASKPTGGRRLLFVFPLAMNLKAHWAERVRDASHAGYDVHVAVPHEAFLDALDLGTAIFHDLPLRRGSPAIIEELKYLRSLFRVMRALKPDILHAVTVRPVIYGGILARMLRVPSAVFSVTGLGYLFIGTGRLSRFLRPLGEEAYALALHHRNCAAVFENPDDRDLFVKQILVEAKDTHVFLGGGIDLDEFSVSPEPEMDKPLVVLPSRLLIDKGVREFVEAARALKSEGVSARFALVGEPDPGNPATLASDEIQNWVREGVIEAWGWRDDIANVIREASIVCLPSYREGAPRSLMEAAAMGRAVITTDVPGCRHVVLPEETGLVVPVRDSKALAGALKRLLLDRALRDQMGLRGRAHAEKNFSTRLASTRMLAIYDILSKRVRKRPAKENAETA